MSTQQSEGTRTEVITIDGDDDETTDDDDDEWRDDDEEKISKVLETVGANGEELGGSAGRLVNPGHVIEAGWFLMQYANQEKDDEIFKLGQKVSTWAFDYGWDNDEEKAPNGGILYFLNMLGLTHFNSFSSIVRGSPSHRLQIYKSNTK